MNSNYIICKNREEVLRIKTKEIVAITIDGYVATIYFGNPIIKFFCCKSLATFEKELEDDLLMRINNNTIVSINHISGYNKINRMITLEGDLTFKISTRKVGKVLKVLCYN